MVGTHQPSGLAAKVVCDEVLWFPSCLHLAGCALMSAVWEK